MLRDLGATPPAADASAGSGFAFGVVGFVFFGSVYVFPSRLTFSSLGFMPGQGMCARGTGLYQGLYGFVSILC